MKTKSKIQILTLLVLILTVAPLTAAARRPINIPDIYDYKTLKCDFHMHTVFSDGSVWPTVRVSEAFNEGFDAIAITDHIEYRPHKDDLVDNLNRSYEIAAGPARTNNILLPRATEITRDTPPGHFNALFLKDVKPLDIKDFMQQMEAAAAQDAFVFWNHPNWKVKTPDEKYILDIHEQLREKKLIHGVEIVNGSGYAAAAHAWALEHNLTLIGNSDIHGPSMIGQSTHDNHRTMTLVFAKENTLDALKEALVEHRTAVWFENKLIAKGDWLEGIFNASINIHKPHNTWRDEIWVQIDNNSDITYDLEKTEGTGPAKIILPANETIILRTKVNSESKKPNLQYKITNLITAPQQYLKVKLQVPE